MKSVRIIGTAALFLLLGTTVPVWAQKGKPDEEQTKSDKGAKGKGNAKAAQPSRHQEAAPQARREQPQQEQRQQRQENQRGQQQEAQQEQRGRQQQEQNQQRQAQQEQRGRQQQEQNQQRQAQQEQRGRQQQEQNQQRAEQQNASRQRQAEQRQATRQVPVDDRPVVVQQGQPDNRPPGWDRGKKVGWNGGTVPPGHQARLPQERQLQLITAQQARVVDYRRSLDQQRLLQTQLLQTQWTMEQRRNRMTYYRYQQDYWARMRQQQLNMQRSYNWNNDPYFYTASDYSYSWGGNNYQTNSYGANMLRSAVNNGYAEGYRAGQADRQDRFGGGFQNSYAYQDANFGYNGRYVSQGDYNYYFRQGFDRGYQDGYNSRMQYGQYSNGNRSILGAVLGTILNLQSMR